RHTRFSRDWSSDVCSSDLRLVRQRRWLFVVTSLFWLVIHSLPVLTGLLVRGLFDALSGAEPAGWGPWTFLALALALDVGRIFLRSEERRVGTECSCRRLAH